MDDISYSRNFSSNILRRPQICCKILVNLKEAGIFRQIFVAFSEYMNFKSRFIWMITRAQMNKKVLEYYLRMRKDHLRKNIFAARLRWSKAWTQASNVRINISVVFWKIHSMYECMLAAVKNHDQNIITQRCILIRSRPMILL